MLNGFFLLLLRNVIFLLMENDVKENRELKLLSLGVNEYFRRCFGKITSSNPLSRTRVAL